VHRKRTNGSAATSKKTDKRTKKTPTDALKTKPPQKLSGSQALPSSGVSQIAGIVIINAMIFQEVLASYDSRVKGIRALLHGISEGAVANTFVEHWDYITRQIDYAPIFSVACNLLAELPSNEELENRLRDMAVTAQTIVSRKAALRQDLMGRIFHKMLLEAKYLGTYYTSIPAATILLRAALRPEAWDGVDWSNTNDLENFKVADLACGTGTLLMAAADAISDNSLRAFFAKHAKTTTLLEHNREVHRLIAENIIHGYDVLPTALHLTAATLAMRAPDIAFDRMNMFSMPLGGRFTRLGSLDFLTSHQLSFDDVFGASTTAVTGKGDAGVQNAYLPKINLCAINPPFTRSVGGNLLFGSVPEKRRAAMQKRLKRIVSENNVKANITAGLGSVFVALANKDLVTGGRIALVLPKAVLNGSAWELTRSIFSRRYHLEYVFSSHDPVRWNFSESTDLSEVMLVAKKLPEGEKLDGLTTVFVNFYRNPTNIIEAFGVSHQLDRVVPGDLEKETGVGRIQLGADTYADVVSLSWKRLVESGSFFWGTAFGQSDLTRVLLRLLEGQLRVPGSKASTPVPLALLGKLGSLGPDRRDIHDAFDHGSSPTAFHALWGRDADENTTLLMRTNAFLEPLARAKKGRNLRKVTDLWPLASDVMIAERVWLVTQSVMAVKLNQEALANVWWPYKLHSPSEEKSKALVLWLNSTLGLLLLLGTRLETRGAWISFKKPILNRLPVIDIPSLSNATINSLAAAFDQLALSDLQPFSKMSSDPVRERIDRAWTNALNLPDLKPVRTLLGREPFVGLERL
jgi:hypothetical protein